MTTALERLIARYGTKRADSADGQQTGKFIGFTVNEDSTTLSESTNASDADILATLGLTGKTLNQGEFHVYGEIPLSDAAVTDDYIKTITASAGSITLIKAKP